MTTSGIRMLGLALCVAVCGVAFAQDASPIQITNAVFQEVEVKAADGTTSKKLVPAAKVIPGGEVVYEITYRNSGTEPATDLAIDNPLPKEVVYVGASVEPATVSVDGGENFGDLQELAVFGADGEPRPAQSTDITNLRWIIASLPPGGEGKVTFRARVK